MASISPPAGVPHKSFDSNHIHILLKRIHIHILLKRIHIHILLKRIHALISSMSPPNHRRSRAQRTGGKNTPSSRSSSTISSSSEAPMSGTTNTMSMTTGAIASPPSTPVLAPEASFSDFPEYNSALDTYRNASLKGRFLPPSTHIRPIDGPSSACCVRTYSAFKPPPVDFIQILSVNLRYGEWLIRFYLGQSFVGEARVYPGQEYSIGPARTWCERTGEEVRIWWGPECICGREEEEG